MIIDDQYKLDQIAEAVKAQFGDDAGYVVLIHISEEVLVTSNFPEKNLTEVLQKCAAHVQEHGPFPVVDEPETEVAPEAPSKPAEGEMEVRPLSDYGDDRDEPDEAPEKA